MAIVIPTDSLATVRPVLQRIESLESRDSVEVILVLPHDDAAASIPAALDITIARVQSIYPLSAARAEGIRRASTEYVFIGETHSFPRNGMFESLLAMHDQGATVAVPMFTNENPTGLVSWAGFLNGYAAWAWPRGEGRIDYAPLFNASYRRSFLLETGDHLESALMTGEDMLSRVRRAGGFAAFAPDARIGHFNIGRPKAWLSQRIVAGRVIASVRSSGWSIGRRAAFALGSPLIPLVLMSRHHSSIRRSMEHSRTSPFVLPILSVGLMFQAVGEFLGYGFGFSEAASRAYDEYEVRQMSYG